MSDGAQMQVLAQHYKHYSKKDKQNTDDKAGCQHLAKYQHTDGNRRERLKCAQDCCGCPDFITFFLPSDSGY